MLHRMLHFLAAVFIGLPAMAVADPVELPDGFFLEPPESLDITYQVYPAYDEVTKVIVAWDGDKPKFYLDVSKLPDGYLDPKPYLGGSIRDLRAAWGDVNIGIAADYTAASGVKGSLLQLAKPAAKGKREVSLIIHHLTDGKVAFVATVGVLDSALKDEIMQESANLLSTVTLNINASNTSKERAETAYIGSWVSEELLENGGLVTANINLKSDLSFHAEVSLNKKIIFIGTGTWSIARGKIFWTYLYGKPEITAEQKEDEDEILSFDGKTWLLKSTISGKTRKFIKLN